MSEIDEPTLERYRSYLLLLARMQLDHRREVKVDASDMVQQTMLEAYAECERFSGDASALSAWLRKVLANNIRDALRRGRRQKRDVAREQSLEAAVERSSVRMAACLALDSTSPSQKAIQGEQLLQLADALLTLSDGQRESIVLHHLENFTIAEVAERLGRSEAAVAGLLHRGLKQLRRQLDSPPT